MRRDGTAKGGSSGGGRASSEKPYNPAKFDKFVRTIDTKFANGQNLTAREWAEADELSDAFVDSGIMTEEQVAELSSVYSEGMSILTDDLEAGHTVAEIYNELLDAGTTPQVAAIVISNLHRQFKAIGKATPYEPDESEEGVGSGGGF